MGTNIAIKLVVFLADGIYSSFNLHKFCIILSKASISVLL